MNDKDCLFGFVMLRFPFNWTKSKQRLFCHHLAFTSKRLGANNRIIHELLFHCIITS